MKKIRLKINHKDERGIISDILENENINAITLITIKKEGFAFHSTYISSKDTSFKSPYELNFEVKSLGEGKSFNIENIYFDNNSYEVQPVTVEILIEFAKYLEINSTLFIEINGFTDNIGDNLDNQLLSENRAKADSRCRSQSLLEAVAH